VGFGLFSVRMASLSSQGWNRRQRESGNIQRMEDLDFGKSGGPWKPAPPAKPQPPSALLSTTAERLRDTATGVN
jgi:hypothetical protein